MRAAKMQKEHWWALIRIIHMKIKQKIHQCKNNRTIYVCRENLQTDCDVTPLHSNYRFIFHQNVVFFHAKKKQSHAGESAESVWVRGKDISTTTTTARAGEQQSSSSTLLTCWATLQARGWSDYRQREVAWLQSLLLLPWWEEPAPSSPHVKCQTFPLGHMFTRPLP